MSLGLLCPGQGDQSPAMFALLDGGESVWDAFRQATGFDAFALSAQDMQVNVVAQPLVCAYQLAVWAHLAPLLPPPVALAGYSVGELAAYGCAGALAPETVVALARRRAELMDAACADGAMVALRGFSRATVAALCQETGAEIAILNDEDRIVCGGAPAAVEALATRAENRGAKATPLAIHTPSHTSLIRPAVAPFLAALQQADWRPPSAPVMAGVSGAAIFSPARAQDTLSQQLSQTIDWASCLDAMCERGCTVLLELGPGAGLARMARDRFPEIPARSTAEFQSLAGAAAWVSSSCGAV